ncbi:PP2C family protein-serine/threonine phosphatase [Motilibacter aurantiacus]|uniref:PP2C family protein-serine/threonine phosphatase n=1 Tax=Motilibacter aurantiacus TaxID=2714955 RepID=UPI00140A9E35|nr:PP2C family protein-serine/threonine phosphatase [Motilibacter aurantiacus]NHC47051.1 serine/threonine-protein phosphatase [Motilibacter aurantiacus]
MSSDERREPIGPQLLQRLLESGRMATPDQVGPIVAAALEPVGARDVAVLLTDYSQRRLLPLPPAEPRPREIDASDAGEAFRLMRPCVRPLQGRQRVCLPLLDGVERLGALELTLPDDVPLDASRMLLLVSFASAVAELVTTKGQYGDSLARAARDRPMSLAAEVQWQALPPLTFATDGVVVAGSVEPSYQVGGDSFDYAADGRRVRFAVLDAMGHGLQASLLSTTAVAAYRNARRGPQPGLPDVVRHMDAAVREAFPGGQYVTAVVADLDLGSGRLDWVLAGHPAPLVLHHGRVERSLEVEPHPPLGLLHLDGADELRVGTTALAPGDCVLAYTDGVVEGRDPDGRFFGVERLVAALTESAAAGLPVPETLRQVMLRVLAHQAGRVQDDATQLLVEWRSGRERQLSPV